MSDIFDKLDNKTSYSSNKAYGDVFDELTPDRRMGKELSSAVVGIPAIAGVGYGAYRAGKGVKDWWQKPQKLISPTEEQLNIIRKYNPAWKDVASTDIPQLISGKARAITGIGETQIRDFTNRSIKSQNILKERLNDFDNTLLKTNVENLSETIKTGYPKFLKGAYEGYEIGLDAIEGFMGQSGVQFNNIDIATILDDTFNDAVKQGVPEARLGNIRKMINELTPMGDDLTVKTKPISFSQAKGYIKNISEELPNETKFRLAERWGKFIETNAPPQVKGELQLLNKRYAPVAEARNTLNKFINRETGLFNTKGIADYTLKYINSKIETGTQRLMQMLGKGNELVSPIEGVEKQFGQVEKIKTQRGRLQKAIEQTKVSRQAKTARMDTNIRNQVNELIALKNKADALVSQRASIIEKYPKRTKGLARAATVVGEGLLTRGLSRAMFPLSVAGNIGQAAGLAQQYNIAQQRGGLHQINPMTGELIPVASPIPPKMLEMIRKYGSISDPNQVYLEDYIT